MWVVNVLRQSFSSFGLNSQHPAEYSQGYLQRSLGREDWAKFLFLQGKITCHRKAKCILHHLDYHGKELKEGDLFQVEMHGYLICIILHQGIIEQVGRRSRKYVRSLVDRDCPAGPFTDISFVGLADIINLCMDSVIQRGCSTLENSL